MKNQKPTGSTIAIAMLESDRQRRGLSKRRYALDVLQLKDAQNYQHWEERGVPRKELVRLSNILGVPAETLDALGGQGIHSQSEKAGVTESMDVSAWYPGEEPVPDGYAAIEAVMLEVGAGNRLVVTEAPEKKLRLYDADFFVSRRCVPNACKAYRVRGESMSPFIFDNDWIVVDTRRRVPPGPGVTDPRLCTFVLRVDAEVMVKMVHRLPDGSLRVSSINQDPIYAPFSVPENRMDSVEIWGGYLERSGGRPMR